MIGFLFSGPSATGKSTVAKSLGQQINAPVLGERTILKQLAQEHGFSRIRNWALTIGVERAIDIALQKTVQIIGQERNCRQLILDGCYDERLVHRLKEEFIDDRFVVIAFDADMEKRELWMAQRLNSTLAEARNEILRIDGFKYYAGMTRILTEADINIKNDRSIEEITMDLKIKLGGLTTHLKVEREG